MIGYVQNEEIQKLGESIIKNFKLLRGMIKNTPLTTDNSPLT